MKAKKYDTQWMVGVSLMAAILLVLWLTKLGFVPIPIVNATIMHVPVIIGAIMYGPLAGGILGGLFGVFSMIHNSTSGTLLAFAFSPFLSTTGIPGALKAIWVSVGCRILIGVIAGWLWILLKKYVSNHKGKQFAVLAFTGAIGSMVNTLSVMGSIYLLFAQQFADAKDIPISGVFGAIMGIVATSGIPEAFVAAILVPPIAKALFKFRTQMKR